MFAMTSYTRSIGMHDTDIVQHGCLVDKASVCPQFWMSINNLKCFLCNLTRMQEQQFQQISFLSLVMLSNYFFWIHNILFFPFLMYIPFSGRSTVLPFISYKGVCLTR